jgi:hypothetical protein
MPENRSFRKAIHQYLRKGGQYWSELGIDILLGAPTDRIMTASEQQFLPNNLEKSIDKCKNTKLVVEKKISIQNVNTLQLAGMREEARETIQIVPHKLDQ